MTIDELCEQLGITQAITEEEYPKYKRAAAPYDLQGKWFDRKALPSTKAVAPIVCERVSEMETVPFEFVKVDGTLYSGNMLLAKP